MRRFVLAAVTLMTAAAFLSAFAATDARAQTGVATMSGEFLESCQSGTVGNFFIACGLEAGTRTMTVRCNADGSGTITWRATGIAVGPYPGTFTETGTATIGPGIGSFRPLTHFEATFHIDATNAVVDGRKFLAPLAQPTPKVVYCNRNLAAGVSIGQVHDYVVRYEAIIKPVTGGSFADEGISNVSVATAGADDVETSFGLLYERFTSDLLVARLLPQAPASVTVTPATDTNKAGEQHCVTATVSDASGNAVGSGVKVFFTVTGANAATGTKTTDASGQAEFCYTGTRVGTDTIRAVADANASGSEDVGDTPPGTATKVYGPAGPATVVVSPPTATNTVGEEHCVTATVTDAFDNATPGVTVYFTVTGTTTGRDTSAGSDVTDANGEAEFCYTAQFPGVDTIKAVADADGDGTGEATEPTGTATKTYVLPVSTPLCQVNISNGGWIIAANGDRASFGGTAKVAKDDRVQGEQVYQDHGPAQTLTVKSTTVAAVTCSGTEATIYGTATIDGAGQFFFRIQVSDLAKNGKGDRYGILLSNGYYSGDQPLRGGNITIKR